MWPQRFRAAVRLLLLACSCGGTAAADAGSAAGGHSPVLLLSRDAVLEVAAAAAYPVSAWV